MFWFKAAWNEVWNLLYLWRQREREANCPAFETLVRPPEFHLKFPILCFLSLDIEGVKSRLQTSRLQTPWETKITTVLPVFKKQLQKLNNNSWA